MIPPVREQQVLLSLSYLWGTYHVIYFFFTLVEVNIHKCKSATITCNVAALFNLYELLRPQLKDKRLWWDRPSNVIKKCSCKLYYLTDEGWTWYGVQCTVYVCAGVIVNWCLCGYVKLSIVATQLLCLMLVLGFAGGKKEKNDCGSASGSHEGESTGCLYFRKSFS